MNAGHALPFVVVGYVHAASPNASGIKDAEGMWVAKMHPLNGDEEGEAKSEALAHQFAATPVLIDALTTLIVTLEARPGLSASSDLSYALARGRDALVEATRQPLVTPKKNKRGGR